jgi:hypothetical protein
MMGKPIGKQGRLKKRLLINGVSGKNDVKIKSA